MNTEINRSAVLSNCGRYRFKLWRNWGDGTGKGVCMFVMLNPSIADAEQDDPTISRCIGFAKSWGYDSLYVGNLLPYRATNPDELEAAMKSGVDPMFTENLGHLSEMMNRADIVVCAWGSHSILQRVRIDQTFLKSMHHDLISKLHYLALTNNGQPRHPLYLKSDLLPVVFKPSL